MPKTLTEFQAELTTKNGDAYFTGVPDELIAMVKVDCYITETVIHDGRVTVEIGYSHDIEDGTAEWGTANTSSEAYRFALGAWLA